MPAQLTRTCPGCNTERATPADFRDVGEANVGRPPGICRVCRVASPALQARQAANVARRRHGRELQASYALRAPALVVAARALSHPDDLKVCPPVAGCGEALPFSAFGVGAHQYDGLATVCLSCAAEAEALRPRKSSPVYTH